MKFCLSCVFFQQQPATLQSLWDPQAILREGPSNSVLKHVPSPVLSSTTSDPPSSSGCTTWQYPVSKSRILDTQMPLWEAGGLHWIQSPPDMALRRLTGLYGFLKEKTLIHHGNNYICNQWNLLSILFTFMMFTPSAYPLGMDYSTKRSKLLLLRWVCAARDFRTLLCFICSTGCTLCTVKVFPHDMLGFKANTL